MSVLSAVEHFPLQICCFDDLAYIGEEATAVFAGTFQSQRAEDRWREVAGLVQKALERVFLGGAAAKAAALSPVVELLRHLELQAERGDISTAEWTEIQKTYLQLLDALYGAFFRHLLCRLPTAVIGGQGYFALDRVRFSRFARLHDQDEGRPTLDRLLDFVCQGGPQFEVEFSWEPLGKHLEGKGETEWRRRTDLGTL